MIRSMQIRHTNLGHIFQLHVHHSLSCVPLRQYRACVVDSLGLGITCAVLCVQGIPILSPLLLCHPYIPHYNLKNFSFTRINICTTEALEIKRTASSVCLRRIVALCGLGVYECGLGVYVVRPGVYGVPSQQILYSARPSRAKTGFPAHSVVQTGYTTPTLRFSDTLNRLVGVV